MQEGQPRNAGRYKQASQGIEELHHMIEHFGWLVVLGPLTESATRAASVNASLTPRLRLAEHSETSQIEFMRRAAGLLTQISQSLYTLCSCEPSVIINVALLLLCLTIFLLSQIAFESNKDKLNSLTIVGNFTDPFGLNVFQ